MPSQLLYGYIFAAIVVALTLPCFLRAQATHGTRIEGRVVDGSGRPLANATVLLRRWVDSSAVTMTSSKTSGEFSIAAPAIGNYRLEISFAGYIPYSQNIRFSGKGNLRLGSIVLHDHALEEAVVMGRRKDYIIAPDKRTFVVGSTLGRTGRHGRRRDEIGAGHQCFYGRQDNAAQWFAYAAD